MLASGKDKALWSANPFPFYPGKNRKTTFLFYLQWDEAIWVSYSQWSVDKSDTGQPPPTWSYSKFSRRFSRLPLSFPTGLNAEDLLQDAELIKYWSHWIEGTWVPESLLGRPPIPIRIWCEEYPLLCRNTELLRLFVTEVRSPSF